LAAVIAIAALVALPGIFALIGLPALQALSLRGLSLLTLLLLIGLSLLAVYRLGPASRRLPIRRILPGVFMATLLWALGSAAFSLYVADFATYDAMYGPLGATVGLLMWFYVSVYVVLLGAELNVALATQAGAW
jgi:membrane protein